MTTLRARMIAWACITLVLLAVLGQVWQINDNPVKTAAGVMVIEVWGIIMFNIRWISDIHSVVSRNEDCLYTALEQWRASVERSLEVAFYRNIILIGIWIGLVSHNIMASAATWALLRAAWSAAWLVFDYEESMKQVAFVLIGVASGLFVRLILPSFSF